MSDTLQAMRRRIANVRELGEVVRTMKAIAASNITQFDRAARASSSYADLVRLGFSVCLDGNLPSAETAPSLPVGVVAFGSDQGLVGLFNDSIATDAAERFQTGRVTLWVVGERLRSRLDDLGVHVGTAYAVPTGIAGITPLIGRLLADVDAALSSARIGSVLLVHNRPIEGGQYDVRKQRLLPFDQGWRQDIKRVAWPTRILPEAVDPEGITLRSLVREYLFASLFRACAESLASENMCRLLAMQVAQKNIGELLDELRLTYNRTRKNAIDGELFDVVFGFQALEGPHAPAGAAPAQ